MTKFVILKIQGPNRHIAQSLGTKMCNLTFSSPNVKQVSGLLNDLSWTLSTCTQVDNLILMIYPFRKDPEGSTFLKVKPD